MKRIFLIGTALLLMVLPLAGCGVAQEDLDDAIAERDAAQAQVTSLQSDLAAAESDLAAAESDLAAAESALAAAESAKASADSAKATAVSAKAAAESDLAAAEAEIATLEAQIADLEAEVAALEAAAVEVVEEEEEVVEEEEEVVEEEEEVAGGGECAEPSFAATEYVNADPAFSVKCPDHWEINELSEESLAAGTVFSAGSGAYKIPGIAVKVIDVAEAAPWADLLLLVTEDPDLEIVSTTEATTADGTPSYETFAYWISGSYPIDGWVVGAQKDGKWVVVYAFTVTMYFPIDEAEAWEIARTLCFQ